MSRDRLRKNVSEQFDLFFRMQNLAGPTLDKILPIVVDYKQAFRELSDMSLPPAEQAEAYAKISDELDRRLETILTTEQITEFHAFNQSILYRPLAQATAAECAANGAGMTPDSITLLSVAIARSKYPSTVIAPTPPASPKMREYRIKADDSALESAASVLSPAQLDIFRRILEKRLQPTPASGN